MRRGNLSKIIIIIIIIIIMLYVGHSPTQVVEIMQKRNKEI